ncbi:hypothetical protein BV911_05270 [Pseudoruegeria sp. SK021]|nr:hypothetical protein BV911_05270 [Pseudoruegeria sp. SK021]
MIVQGRVTAGILSAVVAKVVPGPGVVVLNTNLNFKKAVGINETISGNVEVLSVRKDKPLCTLKVTVVDSDGANCVQGQAATYTVPLDGLCDDGCRGGTFRGCGTLGHARADLRRCGRCSGRSSVGSHRALSNHGRNDGGLGGLRRLDRVCVRWADMGPCANCGDLGHFSDRRQCPVLGCGDGTGRQPVCRHGGDAAIGHRLCLNRFGDLGPALAGGFCRLAMGVSDAGARAGAGRLGDVAVAPVARGPADGRWCALM